MTTKNYNLIFFWAITSLLLLLGLVRPVIEIAVNVERVLVEALDQQPVIGLLLQEKGFDVSKLTSSLPPENSTTQSIASSANKLFQLGNYTAALIVILFSIVTPVVKQVIFLLAILDFGFINQRFVTIARAIHKWAMVDVFVLAMVVLALSAATAWNAVLRDGFYWFLAYYFCAVWLGALVNKHLQQKE